MRSTIPRIPHLPGSNVGPDDLQLTADEARIFLSRPSIVSEKTDGISLNVRYSVSGEVSAALKGDWKDTLGGRVLRAASFWVRIHEEKFRPLLEGGTEIYGEWMWHKIAIAYDALPAAALFYSLRDDKGRLIPRRESLKRLADSGLPVVQPLFRGVIGDRPLASLCRRSAWGRERAEGLIVEIAGENGARWAKWVRPDYQQPSSADVTGEKNTVI